jgi:two-component system CheB/CheR fusion protein
MARKKKAMHATCSEGRPHQTPEEPDESSPPPADTDASPPRGEGEGRLPGLNVVGIGASAGGPMALTEFLQALPADSCTAFVVVSNLDPDHKSALGKILARVSPAPVHEVERGMIVEPNHVYVMLR